ncbi:MAG: phospholipase, partial [Rhizobacter sp.]|nr:phospholipase [Rhizobacter sp.]
MAARSLASLWARSFERGLSVWAREGLRQGHRQGGQVVRALEAQHKPPPGPGDWLPGVAAGMSGLLRFHVYRPPGLHYAERVPLLVML